MKKILYIISALALSAGVTSCDLNEKRVSFTDRESSYETVFMLKSVVNSCYMPLKSMLNASYAMGMECATDLWYDNTSIVDAVCQMSPARPGQGSTVWQQCYKGIMYCNEVIECGLNADKIDDDAKMPYIAEARVLRALYYYYLTCTFNGVPYYTYMVKDMNTLKTIQKLPRTDADVIRQNMYNDLKYYALPYFTVANGRWIRTSEIDGNRAAAPLALMLMAKMMMWNKDWEAAIDAITQLEGIYGAFSETRYPLEETKWCIKNTNESIFEVQHAWSADGIQYAGGVCRLLYPTVSTDGSLSGIMMPYFGTEMTSHSVVRCTNHFAHWRPKSSSTSKVDDGITSMFDPLPLTYGDWNATNNRYDAVLDFNAIETGMIRGAAIDRRCYYVLGLGDLWMLGEYEGVPTASDRTFKEVKSNGRPFAGVKFWVPGLVGNNDGNNYKIFRYADALLMKAECYCEIGDMERAISYLNMTRTRAGVPAKGGATKDEFMQNLRDERALELAGELHRRYDLVRWGVWYDETLKYNGDHTVGKYIQPYHRYYPIPEVQCSLSGGVLSNPEYAGAAQEGTDPEVEDFDE